MHLRIAKHVAMWTAILIAAAGMINIVLSVQELNRSGSQDALIGTFTWAVGIVAAYGMYRMNRIASSALLAFAMWMVLVAIVDKHIGTIGVVGVTAFALIVACGTAATWWRHHSPA